MWLRSLFVGCALLVLAVSAGADAAFVSPMDAPIGPPRAMPKVGLPVAFALPDGCGLSVGGMAVQTGQNGSLIHWIATCPKVAPLEMESYFGVSLGSQGWTQTTSERSIFRTYFRDDLELVFEFAMSGQPSNYVWFGERYWR